MKNKIILSLVIFAVIFTLVSFFSANGDKPNSPSKNLLQALPQADLTGNPIDYNKRLILVDVWATWCPPCRMTVPELIALQQQFSWKNFAVVGLSVDNSPMPVQQFMINYNINYPVAMAGDSLKVLPAVRGIPTMFLINSSGNILKTYVGYTSRDILAADIQAQLN